MKFDLKDVKWSVNGEEIELLGPIEIMGELSSNRDSFKRPSQLPSITLTFKNRGFLSVMFFGTVHTRWRGYLSRLFSRN